MTNYKLPIVTISCHEIYKTSKHRPIKNRLEFLSNFKPILMKIGRIPIQRKGQEIRYQTEVFADEQFYFCSSTLWPRLRTFVNLAHVEYTFV